jgi:hypothetical protein
LDPSSSSDAEASGGEANAFDQVNWPSCMNEYQKNRLREIASQKRLNVQEMCWRCVEKIHTARNEPKTCVNQVNLRIFEYPLSVRGMATATKERFR